MFDPEAKLLCFVPLRSNLIKLKKSAVTKPVTIIKIKVTTKTLFQPNILKSVSLLF